MAQEFCLKIEMKREHIYFIQRDVYKVVFYMWSAMMSDDDIFLKPGPTQWVDPGPGRFGTGMRPG
jgi:hypothetical protein